MADKDDSTQTASKPSKNDEMVATAKGYAIIFGGLFLIYLLGSWDFSITWIVIGFAVWVYRDQTGKTKKQQMKIRSEITNDEKKAIQAHVNDLPSWVYFPDVERAEWLNKIVKRIWPYLDDYVENILKNTVEPSIRESVPSLSFKFVKIDLGNKPLRIGGVKVYTERTKRDEIIMDLDIFYAGDCDMEVSVSKFKAGIEDIQLHGTLRVVMNPLVSVTPLIGGMTIYFLNMPEFDFNMTNLANILDIPGVSGSLRNIIEDQLSNFLVLPNRLVIPMIKNLEVIRLKFPMPQGVLRICVKEAKDLMRKDMAVFSKGSSDPYCVLHVMASSVSLWFVSAIVDVPQGQELIVELWDEDTSSKDESLGNLTVDIETIVQKGFIDTWLPLDDAKSGQLHLKLVWLTLSDQVDALEEARLRMRVLVHAFLP
uniref:Extended synaptotagmin-2-A-like n=1 Tax=Saccoglossus kowalevskii TaxID=10224 RepID=A0ABM0M777_SACKO|nr:PREDICTED: extended synaptotagmin-2-A-like [Saccoglossus kowalevskii]